VTAQTAGTPPRTLLPVQKASSLPMAFPAVLVVPVPAEQAVPVKVPPTPP
jgi:hypothetical protein